MEVLHKCAVCSQEITEKVKKFSEDRYNKTLCMGCQAQEKDAPKPKSPPNNKKWQDDIVNFETLLNDAHNKGLTTVETELIHINRKEQYALFKATAYGRNTKDDKNAPLLKFTGYGDVTNENIGNDTIKKHFGS